MIVAIILIVIVILIIIYYCYIPSGKLCPYILPIIKDLIVLGIVGITVGGYLTYYYQTKSAEREEAQKIIMTTSQLITKRMYQLQRVYLALESSNVKDAQKFFEQYSNDAVPDWNINYRICYYGIQRYFGKNLADELSSIDETPPISEAVFVYFNEAHVAIKKWKDCLEKNTISAKTKVNSMIKTCISEKENSNSSMEKLLKKGATYIKELNNIYENKYES